MAAAGNLLSIGAPRHRADPVIVIVRTRINKNKEDTLEKNTYIFECPVRVDWQSPDRESQILMVVSQLPLAICFPSGLHATDLTLKLREVNTQINRTREEKNWKKTYLPEWPVSVDWQSPDCESQILMVSSPLPLAICFPSGLHATEKTLRFSEVNKRIQRSREGKTWKKTYKFGCRSPSTGNLTGHSDM